MAFIENKFGSTYYEVHGKTQGKGKSEIPLVCLHGGPGGTSRYFGPIKEMAKSRMVILYDQIGCGRSSPLEIKDQKIETLVEDLKNLLKKLKIKKISSFRNKLGGGLGP